jgi:WD40 repeat protein
MSECSICFEEERKMIKCHHCKFDSCEECWKHFFTEGKQTICMNTDCKKKLDLSFIYGNFSYDWIKQNWDPMNKKSYIEIEKSFLPMTQYRLQNPDSFVMDISPFFRKCLVSDCRGYLNDNWQCGLCSSFTCSKCLCLKAELDDQTHTCSKEMLETVSLLQKDTKPCPKCFTPIYKSKGCNQMWCTQCHFAFDWETGKVQKHFHNPHFVEYQQQNNRPVPRSNGDVECDRSLKDSFLKNSLCKKFSQVKTTRNTVNCCCQIEGTNKIVTGTKDYMELWEYDSNGEFRKVKEFYIKSEWICGMIPIPGTKKCVISICGELQVWEYHEGKNTMQSQCVLNDKEVEGYISSICYIPEKKLLLCGGRSSHIYYWVKDNNENFIFKGKKLQHTEHIYSIYNIPNTDFIVSGGKDNNIVIWEYKYNNILCFLTSISTEHETIRAIKKIPHCNRIVSVCHKSLKIWEYSYDFTTFKQVQHESCYGMYLFNIPDTRQYITVGGSTNGVIFWTVNDEGNFEKKFTFTKDYTNFTALYIPEINKIVIGNNNFSLYVWDYDMKIFEKLEKIFDIIKKTIHFKDNEIIPYEYVPLDNEYLRISYLKGEINDDDFENKIYEQYQTREQNQDIKLILDLQLQGITDILYRACLNNDPTIENYLVEVDTLTDYSNMLLEKTGKLFQTNLLKITYNLEEGEPILTKY